MGRRCPWSWSASAPPLALRWQQALKAAGVPAERAFVPMLLWGAEVFIGSAEIEESLPALVDAQLGGAAATAPATAPTAGPPPIYAAYFYDPGCDVCERAEHDLGYLERDYPQLIVQRYDVRDHALLNQHLCLQAGVPEDRHLTAPALFVGDRALVGGEVRYRAIEDLIAPYLISGAAEPWAGWEESQAAAEEAIVTRFSSFGLLTVAGAGLLDGVNPCAFATMIFLVSYLSLRKRRGKELLATGAAFTLGVFVTYLGVGFGFLRFLAALPFLQVIGKWVYGVTAVICLTLAWGSIMDYRKARQGRLQDMTLKLPERLRELSKRLIREGTGARRFVLSALLLGVAVSLVELACTGQVYLPTMIYVLGVPVLRARATLALLIYNLMFIAPLVAVFVMVYYGTTSEQLIAWLGKHAPAVKIGMAVLFVALAGWLIYSIVAL